MKTLLARSSGLRVGLDLALAVIGLRVWHVLLLKVYMDRPALMAAWLAAALALVLLSRDLALRTPPLERSWLQRRWAALEGPDLLFVGLFFVLLFLFHWGFQRAASDGREYFVQVRSLVIDWDLDLANENASFGVRGTAGLYPFGAPLLWVPFFIAAHLWLGILNLFGADFARDGFFNPYQRAIGLGSLIYGFVGLILIYRLVSQYFSRRLAAVATLAVVWGSFVVWYLVVDNSMAHAASMFATTLFIYFWHQTLGNRSTVRWAKLGALAGLMAIVRWQNILFALLPAFEAVSDARESPGKGWFVEARSAAARYAAFGAAFVVVFSPQLVFWKAVNGGWLAYPADAHGANWLAPKLADALFSADRGLFSWTPLIFFAVTGVILFARQRVRLGALFVAVLLLQVYVNSVVEWGGHGFGARRFANCAVVFAFGLAALMSWLRQRPAVAAGLVIGTLVVVNLFFMLDMQTSRVPASGAIPFGRVLESTTSRLGNPFSLPMSTLLALRYGADLTLYERLGNQSFNNVHIDLGAAGDNRFLVRGWSSPETGPEFDLRWSDGPESSIVARLNESVDYALEVRCAPFVHPVDRLQVIEVWMNGELASRLALVPAIHTYRATLPARLMRAGLNELVLRYAYTLSPYELGISDDRRRLAVQFDTLSLIREG